jgi:hypothetical protein|tara:strand:+ start:219 stop:578 length:360 start_codon:yes stop_codon:yes gene_type:complete
MALGTFGIAKIDVAAVTDAAVQFLRDTDLGINMTQQVSQQVLGTTNLTQGPIKKYPTGIMTTKAGATTAAPETIVVKDQVGNTVVLSGFVTGQIRKFSFSEVTGAGTGPAVGEITIFYD